MESRLFRTDIPLPTGAADNPAEPHEQGEPVRGHAALRDAETGVQGLARRLPLDRAAVEAVSRELRVRVPGYYLSLAEPTLDDPIARQCIPDLRELHEAELPEDPGREDDPRHSPVPHLTHRYPDRALLLVTEACPVYCRFCMRKRKTLRPGGVTAETVARGIAHIARTPAIREVIVSGGDPLMLPDARLDAILALLRAIPHVRLLRVHTRMPCAEPRRMTASLAATLGRHAPLHVCVHFNHPREVTPQAREALELLSDAGLPVHNQAVLLRGVNDNAATLRDLFRGLMRCGVHPYYLHHSDLVPGTAHFRLSIQEGLALVESLRREAPELAMLHYVLDTPGGGGKVPLTAPAHGM
ncbi:MAG: KamA family radical SAM protein [SAR324 cluster bacterium]